MTGVSCPLPSPITHDSARAMHAKVRKEMPGLTDAAYRREAARRMGVDYDTYLRAWKKPGKSVPVPSPGIPTAPAESKITKQKVDEIDLSYYSSTIRSKGQATSIRSDGEVIGYYQPVVEGSWETTSTGIRTRFFVDRRGYVALDADKRVIKEGFSAFQRSADDALAAVKEKTPRVKPPPPTEPPPTMGVLTKEQARAAEKDYAKRNGIKPGSAAARRGAADELGMTYDDFLSAWKGDVAVKPKVPRPDPIPSAPQPKTTPKDVGKPDIKLGTDEKSIKTAIAKDPNANAGKFRVESVGPDSKLIMSDAGMSDVEAQIQFARAIGQLLDEGYDIKVLHSVKFQAIVRRPVVWSEPGAVRTLNGAYTTREEVSKYIHQSIVQRNRFATNIQAELSRQFGYVGKGVSSKFKLVNDGGITDQTYFLQNPNVLAFYRDGTGTITMGPTMRSSTMGVQHVGKQQSNWFSKCNGPTDRSGIVNVSDGAKNVFAHEFGHFIEDQIKRTSTVSRRKLFDVMAKDMGLDGDDVFAFMVKEDFNKWPTVKNAAHKYVSRYAATNGAEFFAEVWAEYSRAGDLARPHIKKWGTMIQDILEGIS